LSISFFYIVKIVLFNIWFGGGWLKEYEYKGLRIRWLGHAGFMIIGDFLYYCDPYNIEVDEPADIIFVTHEHFDHYSEKDIRRIVRDTTIFIGATELTNKVARLPGEKVFIKPWNEYDNDKFKLNVVAVPAYNVNKFRAPGIPFHPPEDEKLGFIINIGGVKIYHAGDTDNIPEMDRLKGYSIDIALLPVSGTYVMTADEAADAAKRIMPKVAIPMHYGAIVGDRDDAERFKGLLEGSGIDVVILEKY
jgi:L-ascorbate metabolism protein UlaG (beta-lactamase superfamily)